jgi:hypothetical protein
MALTTQAPVEGEGQLGPHALEGKQRSAAKFVTSRGLRQLAADALGTIVPTLSFYLETGPA